MNGIFESNKLFLFFGDSITDAGRNRENGAHLGSGYVYLLAAELQTRRPDIYLKILNRGIGGDATHNMLARLDKDCLALQPDVLTIQGGLNDATFRSWEPENGIPLTPDVFRLNYRDILERIRTGLPSTRIILMTPFLHIVSPEHYLNYRHVVKFREIIRELAVEYNCLLVPLGEAFDAKFAEGLGPFYTVDGAHPSPAGAKFIADHWLEVVTLSGGPFWN